MQPSYLWIQKVPIPFKIFALFLHNPNIERTPCEQRTHAQANLAKYSWLLNFRDLSHWTTIHLFPITSCSCEKRCQALPAFPYCKWWEAGWGLGTSLAKKYDRAFMTTILPLTMSLSLSLRDGELAFLIQLSWMSLGSSFKEISAAE